MPRPRKLTLPSGIYVRQRTRGPEYWIYWRDEANARHHERGGTTYTYFGFEALMQTVCMLQLRAPKSASVIEFARAAVTRSVTSDRGS